KPPSTQSQGKLIPSQFNWSDNANQQTPVLHDRSTVYDTTDSFWKTWPTVWGGLVTSSLSEKTHDILAQHTPNVSRWISEQTTFNGTPSQLQAAYTHALSNPDKAARQRQ